MHNGTRYDRGMIFDGGYDVRSVSDIVHDRGRNIRGYNRGPVAGLRSDKERNSYTRNILCGSMLSPHDTIPLLKQGKNNKL